MLHEAGVGAQSTILLTKIHFDDLMLKHSHLTKIGTRFRMWNTLGYCSEVTGQPYSFQRCLAPGKSFIKLEAQQHISMMDDSQTSILLRQATRTKKRSTRRKTSKMSPSSRSRPRQRTYTSCTECRRRKQKCNQAKDRPCNHCARRYPPVICTYESQSPPPHGQVVDFQNQHTAQSGSMISSSNYIATTQASMTSFPTIPGSGGHYPSTQSYNPSIPATTYQYVGSTQPTGFSSNQGGYTPTVPTQNSDQYSQTNADYSTGGSGTSAVYFESGDQASGTWSDLTALVNDPYFYDQEENDGSQPNTSGV